MRRFQSARTAVVAIVVLASGFVAAAGAATGATLKIELPKGAHSHHKFTFTVKGTFNATPPNKAWVIVLIQPKSHVCDSTEPKDWHGQSGDLVSPTPESSSPFTLHVKWQGVGHQPVRVCAYAYSQDLPSLGNAGSATLLASARGLIPK